MLGRHRPHNPGFEEREGGQVNYGCFMLGLALSRLGEQGQRALKPLVTSSSFLESSMCMEMMNWDVDFRVDRTSRPCFVE